MHVATYSNIAKYICMNSVAAGHDIIWYIHVIDIVTCSYSNIKLPS